MRYLSVKQPCSGARFHHFVRKPSRSATSTLPSRRSGRFWTTCRTRRKPRTVPATSGHFVAAAAWSSNKRWGDDHMKNRFVGRYIDINDIDINNTVCPMRSQQYRSCNKVAGSGLRNIPIYYQLRFLLHCHFSIYPVEYYSKKNVKIRFYQIQFPQRCTMQVITTSVVQWTQMCPR